MSEPYRGAKDELGERAREDDAIRAFGAWRDRTRMLVLLVFALAGVALAAAGYWFAQELQFRYNRGVAILYVNVGGAALAWGLAFVIGALVARRVVAARTPGKLADLAATYEVPAERLQSFADLVKRL